MPFIATKSGEAPLVDKSQGGRSVVATIEGEFREIVDVLFCGGPITGAPFEFEEPKQHARVQVFTAVAVNRLQLRAEVLARGLEITVLQAPLATQDATRRPRPNGAVDPGESESLLEQALGICSTQDRGAKGRGGESCGRQCLIVDFRRCRDRRSSRVLARLDFFGIREMPTHRQQHACADGEIVAGGIERLLKQPTGCLVVVFDGIRD